MFVMLRNTTLLHCPPPHCIGVEVVGAVTGKPGGPGVCACDETRINVPIASGSLVPRQAG